MTSISDYVCNLIAGRTPISNLYYNVDLARNQRSQSRIFCYRVLFPGIGCKTYKAYDLLRLDEIACCKSMSTLLANYDGSLDSFVTILLKAKNDIRNLYQSRYRAMYIRSAAKIFCYTFNNPFGKAAGVTKNRLTFKSAPNFLNFFCGCEKRRFDATLILAGVNQTNGELLELEPAMN